MSFERGLPMFLRVIKFLQLAFVPTAFYGAAGMIGFGVSFSLGASAPAQVIGLAVLCGLTLAVFMCFQPFWAVSKRPAVSSTRAQLAGLAIAFVVACASWYALGRGATIQQVDLVNVAASLVAWVATLIYLRLVPASKACG